MIFAAKRKLRRFAVYIIAQSLSDKADFEAANAKKNSNCAHKKWPPRLRQPPDYFSLFFEDVENALESFHNALEEVGENLSEVKLGAAR